MVPSSLQGGLRKALSANGTAFTTPAEMTDVPTNSNYALAPRSPDGGMPNLLVLWPFGNGSNDQTFDLRVVGAKLVSDGTNTSYQPAILGRFNCTLSNTTGVTNGALGTGQRVVDTVSVVTNYGTAGSDFLTLSPADNTQARIQVDLQGCPYWKVEISVGTAGGGNAFVGYL